MDCCLLSPPARLQQPPQLPVANPVAPRLLGETRRFTTNVRKNDWNRLKKLQKSSAQGRSKALSWSICRLHAYELGRVFVQKDQMMIDEGLVDQRDRACCGRQQRMPENNGILRLPDPDESGITSITAGCGLEISSWRTVTGCSSDRWKKTRHGIFLPGTCTFKMGWAVAFRL